MNIKLNKDYKIVGDEHNYALYKKTDKDKTPKHVKSKNEIGWKLIGYYQDLDFMYSELIERHIRISDAKTFKEVLVHLKELKASLRKV